MRSVIVLFLFLFSFSAFASDDPTGIFSGHISKLNDKMGLIRIRIDFENQKFLLRKNKVDFWAENHPEFRCEASIVDRSNDYILIKVPDYKTCVSKVHYTVGSYLKFASKDLVKNLQTAKDLASILVKKRLAISSKLKESQKQLDSYPEKIEAINKRYEVLRNKLELEWKEELANLESDRNEDLKNYKQSEIELGELDYKLEQYHVQDENLKVDRWALDPKLFYKK